MMSESLYSESWYRIAAMKPRLRSHIQIHQHQYRGDNWFILQDHATGKVHRFSENTYYLISLMDGHRTVDEIWQTLLVHRQGDDLPTQEEIVHLLHQLHAADALQAEIRPNEEEVGKRRKKQNKADFLGYFINPMALRIPLFDPDRFLQRLLPWVRPLMGKLACLLWVLVVGVALALALQHWQGLSHNFSDRVLSENNLLLLWFLFPVIKVFHELGHAFLVKKWGGEVHAIGLMLLVLVPIPYVDATATASFTRKYQRMFVGAAGMMVELFLAAIAMFVWLNVEDGMVHSLAYNVMVIAGVSTLIFNANPLLRYDGYYILADLIEIPNLAVRSNRYLGYLIQRYVFGATTMQSPVSAEGERGWFVCYALASFVYRMSIMVIIVLFIASKYYFIGVLLAIWVGGMMFLMPLVKSIKSAFSNPLLQRKRMRMSTLSSGFLGILCMVVLFVPFPSWSNAEGVVWAPEHSKVRAQASGFIEQVFAVPGKPVNMGDALFQLSDQELYAQQRILQSELAGLNIKLTAMLIEDRAKSLQVRKEIQQTEAKISHNKAMIEALLVRSPASGVFVLSGRAQDMPGRYIERGALLAYVVGETETLIRAAISQSVADKVRHDSKLIAVRMANHVSHIMEGALVRAVPAATDTLPNLALSVEGGGEIPVDPRSRGEVHALQKYFQFDIRVSDAKTAAFIGQRAYLRFEHEPMPLGQQWYDMIRELLLTRFQI